MDCFVKNSPKEKVEKSSGEVEKDEGQKQKRKKKRRGRERCKSQGKKEKKKKKKGGKSLLWVSVWVPKNSRNNWVMWSENSCQTGGN